MKLSSRLTLLNKFFVMFGTWATLIVQLPRGGLFQASLTFGFSFGLCGVVTLFMARVAGARYERDTFVIRTGFSRQEFPREALAGYRLCRPFTQQFVELYFQCGDEIRSFVLQVPGTLPSADLGKSQAEIVEFLQTILRRNKAVA